MSEPWISKTPTGDDDGWGTPRVRRPFRTMPSPFPAPKDEPKVKPDPIEWVYLAVTVSLEDTGVPGFCRVYFQSKGKKGVLRDYMVPKVNVLLGDVGEGDTTAEGLLALTAANDTSEKCNATFRALWFSKDSSVNWEFVKVEAFSHDLKTVEGSPWEGSVYDIDPHSHVPHPVLKAVESYLPQIPGWTRESGQRVGIDVWAAGFRPPEHPYTSYFSLLIAGDGTILHEVRAPSMA